MKPANYTIITIISLFIVFCFSTSAFAVTRTISAAGGNWDANATWVENAVPTPADDVVATGTSGNVTINAAAACSSIDLTNYVGTLTHNAFTLSVGDASGGALNFSGSWTYFPAGTSSSINFVATSNNGGAGWGITTGGKQLGDINFNGAGGSWTLQDDLTQLNSGSLFNITSGSFSTNNKTLTLGRIQSINSTIRSLTLGSSTLTLTYSGGGRALWFSSSNFTFSAGTSTIIVNTGANGVFEGSGYTFNNVQISASNSFRIWNANTFANLTITGGTGKTDQITFDNNIIVTGTLTLNGNSATSRLLVASDVLGTPRTLTAANVVVANADFRDITGAGTGSWDLTTIPGSLTGDCGGNSLNILFTPTATQYWKHGASASDNWSTVGNWYLATNGGGGAGSRVPLPQDDVVFDAASFSAVGKIVVTDMPRMGKNINWTGVTNNPTLSQNYTGRSLYGSLTLVSGMTLAQGGGWSFEGREASTLTSNGKLLYLVSVNMVGASLTLQDNFSCAGSTFTLKNGTFNANNFNVAIGSLASNYSSTRTLAMGSGTWTVDGGGFNIWNVTSAGMTLNANFSSLLFTYTGNSGSTFIGGGQTYNNISITGGTSVLVVTGSNTFNNFTIGAPKTVTFTSGTTTTINGLFTATGSTGNLITINSSITGSAATLSKLNGVVTDNYLSLQDIAATGGAAWYAGANSANISGNNGWIFFAAPGIFYSVGQSASDLKVASTLTIASGGGTFSVAQTGNIGVGDRVTYGQIDITTFADQGGGVTRITTSGNHGFQVNDVISISGTTNYNGTYQIANVTANTLDIAKTYVVEAGGPAKYLANIAQISAKTSQTQWSLITPRGGTPSARGAAITVNSITREFLSLSLAVAGASDANHLNTTNLVAGNYNLNIPCYYDTGADTTAVAVSGYTTGAINFIKIYTPNITATEANISQRHHGKWDDGKYRLDVSTGNSLVTTVLYLVVDGLQVRSSSSGWNGTGVIGTWSAMGTTIKNNIIKNAKDYVGGTLIAGILLEYDPGIPGMTAKNTYVINNIIISETLNDKHIGIKSRNWTGVYIYNNTIINNNFGITEAVSIGSTIVKNNIVQGANHTPKTYDNTSSGGYVVNVVDGGFFDALSSNNISSDATASGSNPKINTTVAFADAANKDFHLSPSDTAAKGAGVNLSADPNFAFNTDIDGQTRPYGAAWDIGADEYAGPPPVSVITTPTNAGIINIASASPYLINGSATDDGTVTGTEVSTDNGASWSSATCTGCPGASVTWSYNWSPTDGSYTVRSRATDNLLNFENPATGNTVTVDRTAPTVSSSTPANSATGVANNSSVTINWLENIDCATVTTGNITISSGGWAFSSCSGSQAIFTTSGQGGITGYTVTVSTNVKDVNGNAMAAPYAFSYTTVTPAAVYYSVGQNTNNHCGPSGNGTACGNVSITSGLATFTAAQSASNLGVGDRVTYGQIDITTFANLGGGITRITTSANHGFQANDFISISGTTSYNGTYQITNVSAADTVDISKVYVAEAGGGTKLIANIAHIAAKTSQFQWSLITPRGGQSSDRGSAVTVNSIKHEYLSLNAALIGAIDAKHINNADLTIANVVLNIPCYYDSGADTTSLVLGSYTTGASNYIKIYTPFNTTSEANQSQRHNGKWDDSKYSIVSSNSRVLFMYGNIRIDGLQIYNSSLSGDFNVGIRFDSAGDVYLSNLIVRGNPATTGSYTRGLGLGGSASSVYHVWNNIIYDIKGPSAVDFNVASPSRYYLYNNTAVNSTRGFAQGNGGLVYAKNNLTSGTTTGYSGVFDASSTNNISQDATSPNAGATDCGGHSCRTQNVAFNDTDNKDFHLSPTDNVAKNSGVDLSADPILPFNTDIDGQGRSNGGTWDIGADEAATAVYYSVGQNTTDHKTGSPTVSVAGTTATLSIAQTATNMGVGDLVTYAGGTCYISAKTSTTVWSCISATGGTPAQVTNVAVTSIAHAFDSLNNAVANAKDPSHLTTSDLFANNYQLNIPCYYDSGADTTPVMVQNYTTGVPNYIKIYTPTSTMTEANQSQRHQGKWDDGKYRLVVPNDYSSIMAVSVSHVRLEGLQLSGSASHERGITYVDGSTSGERILRSSIIQNTNSASIYSNIVIPYSNSVRNKYVLENNILIGNNFAAELNFNGNLTEVHIYNNTVANTSYFSFRGSSAYIRNLALNNVGYFMDNSGPVTPNTAKVSHIVSNGSLGFNVAGFTATYENRTINFADATNKDYHLSPNDTAAKGAGVNLSADPNFAFSTDIDGQTRTRWDIGADEAATAVYYSVGQNINDHSSGGNVSITAGIATFTVPQTATNLGVGDKVTYNGTTVAYISSKISTTQWRLTTATGGSPEDVTGQTVNTIDHAFTSINAAIGNGMNGAGNASHLITSDLVAGNYQLNIPCYNDSGANTTGLTMAVAYVSAPANYIKIYTPNDITTEVNTSQRHMGKWDDSKFKVDVNGGFNVNISYTVINGLLFDLGSNGVYIYNGANEVKLLNSIIRSSYGASYGIRVDGGGSAHAMNFSYIINNIVYGGSTGITRYYDGAGQKIYVFNNTVHGGSTAGIKDMAGSTLIAKNNLVQGAADGYAGTFIATSDYNISNLAADAPGANSKQASVSFADATNKDYHLAPTDTAAKGVGTNLSADPNFAFNTDIDGQIRTRWDIGADEYYDTTPPVSVITAPTTASIINSASANPYPISGSATDNVAVSGIEVSTDNGGSWTAATCTGCPGASVAWSYNWTPADGSYTVKSRATDSSANVESPAAGNTVTVDRTLPTQVADLTATAASATAINLAWTASTDSGGMAGYKVERSLDNSAYAQIGTPAGITYIDNPPLISNTLYWYRVRATDVAGNDGSYSTAVSKVTLSDDPAGAAATDGTYSTKIRVSWNSGGSQSGYRVYRDGDKNSGTQIYDNTATTFDESITGTHSYYVYSKNSDGALSSGYSSDSGYAVTANVYYSVGQNTADHKNGSPNVTVSGTTATFTTPQSASNLGVGDVIDYGADNKKCYISGKTTTSVWSCVSVTGGTPTPDSGVIVNSISHVFDSLANAIAGAGARLGTSDLVAGNYLLNLPCYYDNGGDAAQVYVQNFTTGASNFIRIYAPANTTSEVNQSQRHRGKSGNNYKLLNAGQFRIYTDYTRIDGIEFSQNTGGIGVYPLSSAGIAATDVRVSNCLIHGFKNAVYMTDSGSVKLSFWNNTIYDGVNNSSSVNNGNAANAFTGCNNTVYGNLRAFNLTAGTIYLKNNIANGQTGICYNLGAATTSNNISSDLTSPNVAFQNKSVSFADAANGDFHLANNDLFARDQGDDLSAGPSLAFNTDIDGQLRPIGGVWDIGADEAGGAVLIKGGVRIDGGVKIKKY